MPQLTQNCTNTCGTCGTPPRPVPWMPAAASLIKVVSIAGTCRTAGDDPSFSVETRSSVSRPWLLPPPDLSEGLPNPAISSSCQISPKGQRARSGGQHSHERCSRVVAADCFESRQDRSGIPADNICTEVRLSFGVSKKAVRAMRMVLRAFLPPIEKHQRRTRNVRVTMIVSVFS